MQYSLKEMHLRLYTKYDLSMLKIIRQIWLFLVLLINVIFFKTHVWFKKFSKILSKLEQKTICIEIQLNEILSAPICGMKSFL